MSSPDYFLLDPENQAFIDHKQSRYNRISWSINLVLIGVVTIVGLYSGLLSWNFWATNLHFDHDGHQTQATIISKNYSGSGKSQSYGLGLNYQTDNGKSFSVSVPVSHDFYNNQAVNLKIAVVYLPENPSQVRIVGQSDPFTGLIFGALLAICLICLPFLLKNFIRQKWLERSGRVLTGTLTDRNVSERYSRYGTIYAVHIDYQFQTPSGKILTGKASYTRKNLNEQDLPWFGASVKVLYANKWVFQLL